MSVVCLKTYRDFRTVEAPVIVPTESSRMQYSAELETPVEKSRVTRPRKKRESSNGLYFYPRLNLWRAANVQLDTDTLRSTSYGWWLMTCRIGKTVVFNDYSYSVTTGQHQRKVRGFLCDRGIDFVTIASPKGLQNLDSAVTNYEYEIRKLEAAIAKPRSHRRKNEERKGQIAALRSKLKLVAKLKQIQAKESA